MKINQVCIYAASSENVAQKYMEAANKIGKYLAINGKSIIYGGGKEGLMGALADGAISENGKVIGVIPKFLESLELGHKEINELRVVETMHQRKAMMLHESEFIVALPGGCGTMDELLEAISWKKLKIIDSKIILFNQDNYYSPLLKMLDKSVEEGFLKSENNLWYVANEIDEVINLICNEFSDTLTQTNMA